MNTITINVKKLKVIRHKNKFDKIILQFDGPSSDAAFNQFPQFIMFAQYGTGVDYVKSVFGITDFDVIDV